MKVKKLAAFTALLAAGGLSVALAAAPKAKSCESWLCKGQTCSPAKYVAVRNAPTLLPLFGSQIYPAIAIEGSLGLAVLLAARLATRRRRPTPAEEAQVKPPTVSDTP
ncbi:MAG: hypothetical protein ABR576_04670 [Thermoanaerobaculia bacterium]